MSLAAPTAAPRYRTKQEFVYRTLRNAIMRCEMEPGERVVIDEIARRLEVSAIPVREALQLLQSEGLVVNVPHVGATVAPISRESITEVFMIMEGLETVASRAAALRMTEADAEGLASLVNAMDAALEDGQPDTWADLNSQFHLTISRLSAMPMLHEMTERVLSRWDRIRRFYFNGVLIHRAQRAQAEHRELLAGLKARDLVELEAVVKRHNEGALEDYSEYLSRTPRT